MRRILIATIVLPFVAFGSAALADSVSATSSSLAGSGSVGYTAGNASAGAVTAAGNSSAAGAQVSRTGPFFSPTYTATTATNSTGGTVAASTSSRGWFSNAGTITGAVQGGSAGASASHP